jgi:hypothetical protein
MSEARLGGLLGASHLANQRDCDTEANVSKELACASNRRSDSGQPPKYRRLCPDAAQGGSRKWLANVESRQLAVELTAYLPYEMTHAGARVAREADLDEPVRKLRRVDAATHPARDGCEALVSGAPSAGHLLALPFASPIEVWAELFAWYACQFLDRNRMMGGNVAHPLPVREGLLGQRFVASDRQGFAQCFPPSSLLKHLVYYRFHTVSMTESDLLSQVQSYYCFGILNSGLMLNP